MTDYIKAFQNPGVYHSDAVRLSDRLAVDATYVDGVMRWNSNNRVPPADVVAFAAFRGMPVDVAKCTVERDADTTKFLTAYRKNYTGPSEEERAEARAAHGPGVELVNVATGHRWTT